MICYIALGSNLGIPQQQLQQALKHLAQQASLQLLKVSSFYQSRALIVEGSAAQSDYINAVAMVDTTLSAQKLLQLLQQVEVLQGRERNEKWAARTLDLDILLYGEQIINTEMLVIPHSQLQYRNFVIIPLFEIAGAITIPGLGNLSLLAEKTAVDGLKKLKNYE